MYWRLYSELEVGMFLESNEWGKRIQVRIIATRLVCVTLSRVPLLANRLII
jgi:hypothetical protein